MDITGLLKQGEIDLKVDVGNTWVNRLIKDTGLPDKARLTSTAIYPYRHGDSQQLSEPVGIRH